MKLYHLLFFWTLVGCQADLTSSSNLNEAPDVNSSQQEYSQPIDTSSDSFALGIYARNPKIIDPSRGLPDELVNSLRVRFYVKAYGEYIVREAYVGRRIGVPVDYERSKVYENRAIEGEQILCIAPKEPYAENMEKFPIWDADPDATPPSLVLSSKDLNDLVASHEIPVSGTMVQQVLAADMTHPSTRVEHILEYIDEKIEQDPHRINKKILGFTRLDKLEIRAVLHKNKIVSLELPKNRRYFELDSIGTTVATYNPEAKKLLIHDDANTGMYLGVRVGFGFQIKD